MPIERLKLVAVPTFSDRDTAFPALMLNGKSNDTPNLAEIPVLGGKFKALTPSLIVRIAFVGLEIPVSIAVCSRYADMGKFVNHDVPGLHLEEARRQNRSGRFVLGK